MQVIGVRTLASMAVLITALATRVPATKVVGGRTVFSRTTARSITLASSRLLTCMRKPLLSNLEHRASVSAVGPAERRRDRRPEQEAAAHEQHVAAIPTQLQHERAAGANKALLASENHGQPAIAATAKPGEFTGQGVIASREEKPATAPNSKTDGPTAVGPNPAGSKLEKEQTAIKPGAPPPQPHPAQTAIKPGVPPPQPAHPEQTAIKPGAPPPQPAHPEQTAIKPGAPPPRPHPEQTAIKPGAPPPQPAHPEQTAIKPAGPPPPPHPAPAVAARSSPATAKPACPPGKTLAEVNGRPICR